MRVQFEFLLLVDGPKSTSWEPNIKAMDITKSIYTYYARFEGVDYGWNLGYWGVDHGVAIVYMLTT